MSCKRSVAREARHLRHRFTRDEGSGVQRDGHPRVAKSSCANKICPPGRRRRDGRCLDRVRRIPVTDIAVFAVHETLLNATARHIRRLEVTEKSNRHDDVALLVAAGNAVSGAVEGIAAVRLDPLEEYFSERNRASFILRFLNTSILAGPWDRKANVKNKGSRLASL